MFSGFPSLKGAGGSATAAGVSEKPQNPEDIPKEELMHLCMKMNKRMQAMETKGKELSKKRTALLAERQKLLDLVQSTVGMSLSAKDDGELDMGLIESSWNQWEQQNTARISDLEAQLSTSEHNAKKTVALLEARHRKELADLQSSSIPAAAAAAVGGGGGVGGASGEQPAEGDEAAGISVATGAGAALPASSAAIITDDGNKLRKEIEILANEKQDLQERLDNAELQIRKIMSELESARSKEAYARDQAANATGALQTKTKLAEDVQKQMDSLKTTFEEKILFMQMQLNSAKSKEDVREKEMATIRQQLDKAKQRVAALHTLAEEKEMAVQSNKEMIQALQLRLIELEPELGSAREKLKEQERNNAANTMMRKEQQALVESLRGDLRIMMEKLDEQKAEQKRLEEYKAKAEGQLLKLTSLSEQVNTLQAGMEEKNSLITRLRAENQSSERNHAMRTAMLATCEAQLEALRTELAGKDETVREAVERVTLLQTQLAASEARMQERVKESTVRIDELEAAASAAASAAEEALASLRRSNEEVLENLKKDHAKKSSMARTLLSEREEEVRVLSAKVQSLQEEISSGAPSERKIFELAQTQAKRDATYGVHSDTRELAFQQVQAALAGKDLDLAKAQQKLTALSTEVMELRRTHQREGINMDYLKNIVIQYMTFPVQSSEKLALIPVLAMLLQFNGKELAEVEKMNRSPAWGSRPVKEVKPRSISGPGSAGSSTPAGIAALPPGRGKQQQQQQRGSNVSGSNNTGSGKRPGAGIPISSGVQIDGIAIGGGSSAAVLNRKENNNSNNIGSSNSSSGSTSKAGIPLPSPPQASAAAAAAGTRDRQDSASSIEFSPREQQQQRGGERNTSDDSLSKLVGGSSGSDPDLQRKMMMLATSSDVMDMSVTFEEIDLNSSYSMETPRRDNNNFNKNKDGCGSDERVVSQTV